MLQDVGSSVATPSSSAREAHKREWDLINSKTIYIVIICFAYDGSVVQIIKNVP